MAGFTEKTWTSEFTQTLADAICVNLELAMPLTLAAEAEGVHRAQVYAWMGENEAFRKQVTRARARGTKKLVEISLEGGKGSAAALWHLERRYRDDYAPPKKEDNQPAEVRITIEGGLRAQAEESKNGKGDAPTP